MVQWIEIAGLLPASILETEKRQIMARLHLTDAAVRALKGTAKYVTYWDDVTPGFGIRVGLRKKSWTVMRGPNRQRISFAEYPETSLSDARAEAKRLLSEKPEEKSPAVSFEAAKDLFIEDNYKDAKPRTKKEAKRLLDKHCKTLNPKQLTELTDTDLQSVLDKLADRPSEALHTYRVLRCLLRWCTRPPRRYLKHSPMDGYAAPSQDKKGTRILTDPELVRLWNAATAMKWDLPKFLILWGTRKTETAAIRRDWIVDCVLTIPGAHTKNKRDHAIPLCPIAMRLLETIPNTGPYFFPGRWDKDAPFHEGSWGKLKAELFKAAGVKNWQLRDLRRTFRSTMARLGVPRDLCEVLINHAPPVLDEIYDRYDRLAEKRAALERYEAHLTALFKPATLRAA